MDDKESRHVWPWRQMEIGDSFFVAFADGADKANMAARHLNYRDKTIRISAKARTENGVRGYRFWRVKPRVISTLAIPDDIDELDAL